MYRKYDESDGMQAQEVQRQSTCNKFLALNGTYVVCSVSYGCAKSYTLACERQNTRHGANVFKVSEFKCTMHNIKFFV